MNRIAQHVIKRVTTEWMNLTTSLHRIYPSTAIRPQSAYDIFHIEDDPNAPAGDVELKINPIVFNLPEKAGGQQSLFIAIGGWLSFNDVNLAPEPLMTKSFGTEMGYFRRRGGRLEHVYGVHYDLDETKPGHPVFHAQVSSQLSFGDSIRSLYHLTDEVVNDFSPKYSNIRIPSAQMDIFSTAVQICADHYLALGGLSPPVTAAFERVRETNSFFLGAAHRMPFLNGLPASRCYRAAHWYR
jgi:hypothetical protein